MDTPERRSVEASEPRTDLAAEVARLRRDQTSLLGLLVLVTASLVILLLRMTLLQHGTVQSQKPLVERVESQDLPRQRAVIDEFEKFGASHPDFAETVLRKYGLAGGAGATNAPAR